MQVIPVLDLMGGQVVRAQRGQRAAYQPLRSPLCDSAEPLATARALQRHTGSTLLYVADLDALQGRPAQLALLARLLADDPHRECWLDAGFADLAAARQLLDELAQALPGAERRVTPVFGSESLRDADALWALTQTPGAPACVLSLDRRDGQKLDAAGCWHTPAAWPARVIVMTLERVGAGSGPDLATLAELRRQAPRAWLVGAGGVRHAADLALAAEAGAQAWLVASALHDGGLAAIPSGSGGQAAIDRGPNPAADGR